MFESLRRLTTDPDGLPKTPFLKQDLDKIMDKIATDIKALETEFNEAVRLHAEACLAAIEGGADECNARDKANAVFTKAERALADARAAQTAAERRKLVGDEKAKSKAFADRQKRVAANQKKVVKTSKKLDELFDQVAVEVINLRDETKDLRLDGVRDAQTPIINISRVLGSRLRHSGITLGHVHPFDDKPIKLVDLCPDLSSAVAAVRHGQ